VEVSVRLPKGVSEGVEKAPPEFRPNRDPSIKLAVLTAYPSRRAPTFDVASGVKLGDGIAYDLPAAEGELRDECCEDVVRWRHGSEGFSSRPQL
jgi:hypothetical protein